MAHAPNDADPGDAGEQHTSYPLYHGACGVMWALHHLQSVGAARLSRSYAPYVDALLPLNRAWLGNDNPEQHASYLLGDTGILLLSERLNPSPHTADRLQALIAGNLDNPARELMWGSPGTMLAALFLHELNAEARWADLFQRSARKLWSQLLWSDEHQCHYWTQDVYGRQSSYLDVVHGFVATASPLIRGRHLLEADEWRAWQDCIDNTVRRSATLEDGRASWPALLNTPEGQSPRMLMQFCHGAPGFAIFLWDCIHGTARFPTLDVFFGGEG